jgi:hypothetical protein
VRVAHPHGIKIHTCGDALCTRHTHVGAGVKLKRYGSTMDTPRMHTHAQAKNQIKIQVARTRAHTRIHTSYTRKALGPLALRLVRTCSLS